VVAAVAGTGGSAGAVAGQRLTPGAVFTETNTVPNYVLMFRRNADGTLDQAGQVATGGNGRPVHNPPLDLPYLQTGGSVNLADDGGSRKCLFAVNAGSNTVSSFVVRNDGLELADQKPTNGSRPISITSTRRGPTNLVLYVLNSDDGSASIQGYYVLGGCRLAEIPGSWHLTPSPTSIPTQITFNQRGTVLSVVEPFTAADGDIAVFPVDHRGVAGTPVVSPSTGPNPYGEAWDSHDHLTVTNQFLVNVPGGTVSSYRLASNNTLVPISEVPAPGHPCWNAITKNDKFLYTTQPAAPFVGADGIQVFRIGRDGTLTSAGPGENTMYNAVDEWLSHDSRYLYVLSDGLVPFLPFSAIDEYALDPDSGHLTHIGTIQLPSNSTSGLAAW
jgi:6-phosphogluconolactonase (cycloisomerase 2 family)